MKWIRDIANYIKHKSGVSYVNIDFNSICEIQKGTEKMSDAYYSKRIDIDSDFTKIIECHNNLVNLYSFIMKELNKEVEKERIEYNNKQQVIKIN